MKQKYLAGSTKEVELALAEDKLFLSQENKNSKTRIN